MLLCFPFLLGHVGNCVLVIGKGASLKSKLEGFPLLFQIFLFGFEGWGDGARGCVGGVSLTLTSSP